MKNYKLMLMKKILILGSSNTDMVVKSERLPKPGETIIGGDFMINPGGKGANQAVAASRLGGDVIFVCKVGNDDFGERTCAILEKEKIDTSYIIKEKGGISGVALITVDKDGENSIVVASGTNASFSVSDLSDVKDVIKNASILVLQLEIPIGTAIEASKIAKENGVTVMLNPAPAPSNGIPKELLDNVDIIIPNETEAEIITGIEVFNSETAVKAAEVMNGMGISTVIITMGSKGAFLKDNKHSILIPSTKVNAIDTTAAGDTFCGALSVAFAESQDIVDAIKFACKASAIAVTRMGAQASIPYRKEL
jgi:ribokinase